MIIHVVQRGDTLWNIARRYGVSVQRLMADNGLSGSQPLAVGQALAVLVPAVTYTVRRGDTLTSIASAYGVTVMELLQNNPDIVSAQTLYAGQTITIRFTGRKIREMSFNGYAYPHIRREVLTRALPYLTYLTIFGYGFTDSGELTVIDDSPLISMAYRYNTVPVMLLSSISDGSGFSTERASRLFNDIAFQNKVLDNVIAKMLEKGYMGLDSDFEYIAPEDADAYLGFLGNASARLREYGFFLNTDLAPKTSAFQTGLLYEAHDYPAIGGISDTVLLMTYEWGYMYGPPMAVAPLDQVRRVVRYAVTEIPPEKIFMGIPNYGYDWTLPYEKGMSRAQVISNQYAVTLASRHGAVIQFDETSQAPHFTYVHSGSRHEVWFEDVRSIEGKLALIDDYDLRGAGYWTVMYPFAQNFALISARYNVRKII